MFRGERAATDSLVHALDLRDIQRARRIADQHEPRRLHAWQRLPAASSDRAGAIGQKLAALKQRVNPRMVLELLERLERPEARILVVESDDITDVHAIVIEVVEKASAIGAGVDRPADRMLDQSGFDAAGGQLPQFLDSETVGLGSTAVGEAKLRDELRMLRNKLLVLGGKDDVLSA